MEPNIKTGEADHYLQKRDYMQHSDNSPLGGPDHESCETSEEGQIISTGGKEEQRIDGRNFIQDWDDGMMYNGRMNYRCSKLREWLEQRYRGTA